MKIIYVYLTFVLIAVIGWISNIVTVLHNINNDITGLFVLQCIGIIAAPLGSILGWISLLS